MRQWFAFVKFSHTLFALPFALAAMLVAARDREPRGWPGWRIFLLIVAAMVAARTCAMIFNRIVDRQFDRLNPRTSDRHLPSGSISLVAAWTVWALSGVALVAISYGINPICFYLSPVAVVIICFYSLTKRFTDFSHVFLGIALALAPVGAWLAVTGGETTWADGALMGLLAASVIFWLIGFDVIYALQDYEFDRAHGLHSLVVRWGPQNALQAAFLSHLIMVLLLGVFGLLLKFRLAYFAGIAIIVMSLMLEHWLARRRSLKWINVAFFRLNVLVSAVFLTATAAEVIFHGGFRWTR